MTPETAETIGSWYHGRQVLRFVQTGEHARAESEHLSRMTDAQLAELRRYAETVQVLVHLEQQRRNR